MGICGHHRYRRHDGSTSLLPHYIATTLKNVLIGKRRGAIQVEKGTYPIQSQPSPTLSPRSKGKWFFLRVRNRVP